MKDRAPDPFPFPLGAGDAADDDDDVVIALAFRRSLVALLVLGLVAGLVLLLGDADDEPPPQALTVLAGPGATPRAGNAPAVTFTDVTRAAGIDFVHANGAVGGKYLPEAMGPGCAFFDYDGDGDPDLLLPNSAAWPWDAAGRAASTPPALYRNDGAGHFEDVTAATGLTETFYGQGVACGDYDADGDVDVFLTGVGEDRLYRNEGERFTDVTAEAGVVATAGAWGSSAGFCDLDADGDLDLWVCHYVRWSREIDDAQNYTLKGIGRAYARPTSFEGSHSRLFRNDGDGTFTDVSSRAGIQITNPATRVPVGKALGLVFEDFDLDGDLDVFVANDTVRNFLFENEGDLRFAEIGERAGVAYDSHGRATGAMGVDAAELREGEPTSIAVGNYAGEMSSLYVARRRMLFSDAAISEGIGAASRKALSFGVLFLDYDLDGRLDLFQTNGHLEEEIHKVQPSQHYEQPSQLFWNAGPEARGAYAEVAPDRLGDLSRAVVGRGAAYADIDADGDLDLVITQCGRSPLLLRNDQALGHHWLRIVLVPKGGRSPIGAQVALTVAGSPRQHRLVSPSRSYLSQVELPVTFGLGQAVTVASLVVTWPDGSRQAVDVPAVDRVLRVEQR